MENFKEGVLGVKFRSHNFFGHWNEARFWGQTNLEKNVNHVFKVHPTGPNSGYLFFLDFQFY